MIEKNCLEKIEPRIGSYFVSKRNDGKYYILKNEGYMVTDATINDPVMMWNGIESFDSLVRAYTWLKKHVQELL